MADVSRRAFLGGMAAIATVPSVAVASIIEEIPVEFGFCPSFDTKKYETLSDLIRETVKNNRQLILDNLSRDNPLFLKVNDEKVAKITYLDPDEQTRRMKERLNKRLPRHYSGEVCRGKASTPNIWKGEYES